MSAHLPAAWDAFVATPLFGASLTLAAYLLAQRIWARLGKPAAANPTMLAIAFVVATLAATGVSFEDYWHGGQFIDFFLGPATVALALPLYRSDGRIREAALAITTGLIVGSAAAIASAIAVVTVTGGDRVLAMSMAPKSATTPVAIATAAANGGAGAIAAAFTLTAGILGALFGPAILSLVRVRDPHVRGFAVGLSSHGIGIARLVESEPGIAPAFAALAMAANAILTPLLVPLVALALP